MNCTNCGTYNEPGAKYCIKCGNSLATNNIELLDVDKKANDNSEEEPVLLTTPQDNNTLEDINNTISEVASTENNNFQSSQTFNPIIEENNMAPESNPSMIQDQKSTVKNNDNKFNFLMYLVAVFLRPKQAYKEEENNLNNTKNSFILTLIISIIMTILGFLQTIISTVRVPQYDFAGGGLSYSWQWNNLKNIKFIQVIGKSFFIYFCIILAIAGAFYLGSLVIKKQISFIKNISISASAMVPVIVGAMILAPITGLIWSPLSFVFAVVGFIYSFLIFYELMNDYLDLNDDIKIWFNLSCISILLIVVYYFLLKTLISAI